MCDPSPSGRPLCLGRVRVGAALLIPPSRAPGGTRDWGTAAQSLPGTPLFPSRDSWSLSTQSRLWQRCVLGSASLVLASFSGPHLVRLGVREAEKSLPALPDPGPARVHSAAPQGAPRSQDGRPQPRCPLGSGGGDPRCPALPLGSECSQGEEEAAVLSQPPHNPSGRDTFKTDSLSSRPGWSWAAVAERAEADACSAGVAGCGWTCWPSSPGVGGAGGGRSRDTQPAPAATSILPRPVLARPLSRNPRLQGCGGACAPPYPGWSLCEVPPPCGPGRPRPEVR